MIAVSFIMVALGLASATRIRAADASDPVAVRALLFAQADSLDESLTSLAAALRSYARGSRDESAARSALSRARAGYKHLEGPLEFYAPALAAAFNSRRQEVDDDDAPPPATLAAAGFPALEKLLWPALGRGVADSAARIVDGIHPLVVRAKSLIPELAPTGAQLIEILRLEIARISTLGIAGFDAPVSRDAMREASSALDGLRSLIGVAGPSYWPALRGERSAADSSLARAAAYLRANPDFESFNRLAFIVQFVEPAADAIDSLRRAARTIPVRIPRAWRYDAPSPYASNAFDVRAYMPTTAPRATPELIALGQRLFGDPALSGDGTRSCATCHAPARAFADGVAHASNIHRGGKPVARNTPTLLNAAMQPAQFADERAASLEDQVLEVLRSVSEMSSSAEHAAVAVGRNARYRAQFAGAFAAPESSAVTPLHLRQAIAAYVRSLVALDAPFDHALRGDTLALTAEQRRGFTLFMGKGGCGTCHFAPLFSGVTPPLYLASDVEVIGTPDSPRTPAATDPDSGRALIDRLPAHVRAFKTPALRNVALTAPYMHNGAFRTLDEVVAFYDGGGGVGSGARIGNQTLAADSLHLTTGERAAIVAFLRALTDTVPHRP